jgi:molybdenum ABC transporter molybdate-binding protein
MKPSVWIPLATAAAAAVLIALLTWKTPAPATRALPAARPLLVFCAAGIQTPVEAVKHDYSETYGIPVQLQYGGSGTLLSNLRIAGAGDLFIAADASYVESARALGLIAESLPVARQHPVIAVAKGNPKHIQNLEDLLRPDVRFALASPDAASIGRTVRALLAKAGLWESFASRVTVLKPTVNDVATDVKIGSVDAGIIWDATVRQVDGLEAVSVPMFANAAETISVSVLRASAQPPAALRFARYLSAADRGLKRFAESHYAPVEGDMWVDRPEIVLFSGAMLRPGIERTLKEFEQREGCRISTVYNGCGVLVAQMRTGQRPDAYFSCDTTFMESVADLYFDPVNVVDNQLMIIVSKGNPKGIRNAQDLAQPGIRLGLPDHDKSAMGSIAWKMLQEMKLTEALKPNLKLESPTGDFLINQIRTGSLDAIIACRSNWSGVREHLDAVPLDHPLARMTQPYAVGRATRHAQMMQRLQAALTGAASKDRFESVGFGWRYQQDRQP